jgi:ATP-dependent helicase/nuclease subunit A
MSGWDTASLIDDDGARTRRAVGQIADLPAEEPLARGEADVDEILSRIDFVYPHLASASIKASVAASEFKGAFDYTQSPEEQSPVHEPEFLIPPSKYVVASEGDAVSRGVITHRVLQHLDFKKAADRAGVAAELQRMTAEGVAGPEATAMVDVESLAWFVSTPLADAIRDAGAGYRREFSYITAEALGVFDRSLDAPTDDHVLVRGIVDGILPAEGGLEIVDFKTDAVRRKDVEERAERYRPQMELYARAMARLWGKPVRKCWLVFLSPRRLVCWNDSGDGWRLETSRPSDNRP